MIQINKYILEKLRINKDTKINDKFVQEILEFLYGEPSDADPKEVKIFQEWVKENNVEHMTIICSESQILNYYNEALDNIKELTNKYKNNDEVDLILQDNTFTLLGDLVYNDKYERIYIFINKNNGWMCYNVKGIVQIYFIPNEISKEEAAKYVSK